MSTNTLDMIQALQTVTTDPGITEAFNQGLIFGATVVAAGMVFWMIRSTVGGDREES